MIGLLAQSHALTLAVLSNHRMEQPEMLSDTYLRSCKMLANQTEKLAILNAGVRSTMGANREAKEGVDDLSAEYVKIYKLFLPALLEFGRRELKLE